MAKVTQLLGKLTPAHPDIIQVIKSIREKYNFPEIALGDDTLAEILGADDEIDLDTLRQDIETELRKKPELLPSQAASIYKLFQIKEETNLDFPEMENLSDELRNYIKTMMEYVIFIFEPSRIALDGFFSSLTNHILEYLLTGEAQEVPENWFQAAYTTNIMGEPVIMAMCSQFADPNEVAQLFKAQYTKTFGRDRPKITAGQMNTADYLRMKWEGKSIAYLVDIYAENHPSQFPKDFRTNKSAKDKQYQLMKKRLQRLEKSFDKLLGDKN